MPPKTLETEIAGAVRKRIESGEGKPYACLMTELRERGFNTQDSAVARRWANEILRKRLKDIEPPQQKEFSLPLR